MKTLIQRKALIETIILALGLILIGLAACEIVIVSHMAQ
jgi:hypothetical protein